MTDNIDITIFIPVRNGQEYLKETLDSISLQSYRNFKIVVLDNCSNDASLEIIQSFSELPIEIASAEAPLKLSENFNRALRLADTPLFCIMHSDDVYEQNYLKEMRALMLAHPTALAGFCATTPINSESRKIFDFKYDLKNRYDFKSLSASEQMQAMAAANLIPAPTIMFRKEVTNKVGYYENYEFNLDWDYSIRILISGSYFVNTNNKLLLYRIHDKQLTHEFTKGKEKYLERIDILSEKMEDINRIIGRGEYLNRKMVLNSAFLVLLWDLRDDCRFGNKDSFLGKMDVLSRYSDTKVGQFYAVISKTLFGMGVFGTWLLQLAGCFGYLASLSRLKARDIRHRILNGKTMGMGDGQ